MNHTFRVAFAVVIVLLGIQLQTASAAPVTLEWVTTSSSTGPVGFYCDTCTVSLQTRQSTSAGVQASFVLADVALLRSTLAFTNNGGFSPTNQILSASLSSQEFFARASMIDDPVARFPGDPNICNLGTRDAAGNPNRCLVNAVLTADTVNPGRYIGTLGFSANNAFVSIGSQALSWGGSTSRSPSSLELSGYWQVRNSGSVPMPTGLVLLGLGLLSMAAVKRRTA
jgi:hypothetical protein